MRRLPSPLWGGTEGGGRTTGFPVHPVIRPPSLSLPHEGEGKRVADCCRAEAIE